MARNSGIAWSDEPLLFMLDADNRIRPPALAASRPPWTSAALISHILRPLSSANRPTSAPPTSGTSTG